MPKLKSNPMIVLNDAGDNTNLELFVSSNLPTAQVKDGSAINPSWETTPLVLSPSVYLNNETLENPTITWQRRSGGGAYTSTLVSGESVTNNVLTVNKNVLLDDPNRIITYKCTLTYGAITRTDEKSFSLSLVGSTGDKGQSVFVTYNDSDSTPATPTGSGSTNGWHTNMTSAAVWMSIKAAYDIASGTWGAPVKIKGTDGRGVINTVITYQASSSGSSIPTGTWVTNIPTVSSGQYLWTKTDTYYSDGNVTTGYSIGKIGENGKDGTNGINGNDGKGIKSTVITYQAHTSGTEVPSGTWTTGIPNVAANQYLWTRTIITYTDNTTSTAYSVGKMGANGSDGYSIVLTNDSHTFAGSTNSALASNITCNVVVYKGASQIGATIGTITGAPTGMTTMIINNGTTTAGFTITVTTAMTTANGVLSVPVTVDGKTFNKTFSYSVAFKGATGDSAALVDITPSALYFKSTTGKDGTFAPGYIYLYPRFQSATYSDWQYSVNGITWVSVSGASGLTVDTYNSIENSLRISKNSTLYTDSITSISFRCNATNAAIYDVVSIAKIYDVVDLQIGGRNLVRNTDMKSSWGVWTSIRGASSLTDDGVKVTSTQIGQNAAVSNLSIIPVIGDTFTVSCNVRGNLDVLEIYLLAKSGTNEREFYSKTSGVINPDTFTKITRTFTFNNTNEQPTDRLFIGGQFTEVGQWIEIQKESVKLERGNKATDWSPAPEDINTAIDQESGIVAMLSNESQFFVANASGVPTATSVILDVIGYKGAAQQNTTVGTITGLPSAGMTATISNNSTQNTKITIAVTTALTSAIADYGVLTIPITIADKTINKKFNWAKSKAGATGASSVSFEIYSNTGLVFHDEDSITLQTQKLYGATNITIGGSTTIQWSKMVNGAWTNTWKYDSGDTNNVPATGETLVVKHGEVNGSQLYRCTLTYGGKAYTDIVTITDKTDTYQSNIIAIGGNVLTGGELGRIAYASLFQGATEEDKLLCPIYSTGTTPVANKAYYVLEDGVITIKKYVGGTWVVDNTVKQEYLYTWFIIDKYTGEQQEIGSGKVIYITNDIVSRSGTVQCVIGNVSVCSENFTDANDPIIGSEEPKIANKGQLWLNTDDGLLYAYDDGWYPVNSGQNRTYTSAPIVRTDCCYYKAGDLWIVGENDSAYTDARVGTLLIATNNLQDADNWTVAEWKNRLAVDWSNKLYYDEALNTLTDYQQRLSAYMSFEVDGLKIGANNTEFYTKVTPYDLGFYQGSEKVAYVSNKKMYNTSLEVSNDVQIAKHKSDEQPNPQKPYFMIGNFRFIIEENGSMSIARSLTISPQPRVKGYDVSGRIITIYFTPWSSNVSYGYKSNHDSTAIGNIQLLNDEGTVLGKTTATGAGYIRITASANLPKNVIITLPYHVVYNIGQSNSDYDLTDVGNDAITLAIATDV